MCVSECVCVCMCVFVCWGVGMGGVRPRFNVPFVRCGIIFRLSHTQDPHSHLPRGRDPDGVRTTDPYYGRRAHYPLSHGRLTTNLIIDMLLAIAK